MTAEPEIDCCPWCKSSNCQVHFLNFATPLNKESPMWVECHNCGSQGPVVWYSGKRNNTEAIAAWNTRAEPDELPEWAKKAIMKRIQTIDPKYTASYREGLSDAYWDVLYIRREDEE